VTAVEEQNSSYSEKTQILHLPLGNKGLLNWIFVADLDFKYSKKSHTKTQELLTNTCCFTWHTAVMMLYLS